MSEIIPGEHRAVIVDYGISETKDKNPQVAVEFQILELPDGLTPSAYDEAQVKPDCQILGNLTWFGSLKAGNGADEITVDSLLKARFDPNKHSISDLCDGPKGNVLDASIVYGVSVKENVYDGKTTLRLSSFWVPGEGGGPGIRKLEKGDAVAKLQGYAVDSLLKAAHARSQAGPQGPVNEKPASAAATPGAKKPKF